MHPRPHARGPARRHPPVAIYARHHVAVHFDGAAARAVDALRDTWDPRMRAIAPAHVTLVYPEETLDVAALLDHLAAAARATAPVPLRLGRITGADGAVAALVDDPTGRLTTLRDRLAQRPLHHPFHATIAHPRTAADPRACLRALDGRDLDVPFTAHEVLWTRTDHEGRRVLARHPLGG